MDKNNPRKKRPRDPVERAKSVFDEAVGDAPPESPPPQRSPVSEAASILGKLGGSKGGLARARNLTEAERSEAARRAAQARWTKKNVK